MRITYDAEVDALRGAIHAMLNDAGAPAAAAQPHITMVK